MGRAVSSVFWRGSRGKLQKETDFLAKTQSTAKNAKKQSLLFFLGFLGVLCGTWRLGEKFCVSDKLPLSFKNVTPSRSGFHRPGVLVACSGRLCEPHGPADTHHSRGRRSQFRPGADFRRLSHCASGSHRRGELRVLGQLLHADSQPRTFRLVSLSRCRLPPQACRGRHWRGGFDLRLCGGAYRGVGACRVAARPCEGSARGVRGYSTPGHCQPPARALWPRRGGGSALAGRV